MSIQIGHASIDERGKIGGGAAGDQTGKEVCIRNWYNRPWNKILRAKNAAVAARIAKAMRQACANNNIGYDQYQRTTLYNQAKAAGWDLSKINTPCECDCSSLVAVCVNAAGVTVSKDIYTGNEASALLATGQFTCLTESKYLNSDRYLKEGDILLYEGGHTAIALENGSAGGASSATTTTATGKVDYATGRDNSLAGTYRTTANLNLRTGAGTNKPVLCVIPKGAAVQNYGYYSMNGSTRWLYVVYNGKVGFASGKYLRK